MLESSHYKHSELSGKHKDLVVSFWHYVENHLDKVNVERISDQNQKVGKIDNSINFYDELLQNIFSFHIELLP